MTAAAILTDDETRKSEFITARDRRIGAGHASSDDRIATALGWIDEVCEGDAAPRKLHQSLEQGMAWGGALITVLGMILGGSATLGLFYFDGSGRVNAISIIAILVLLPGLFLLPFVIAALPPSALARIPGASAFGALSRGLSPGRLAAGAMRLSPVGVRQAWEKVSGQALRHQSLFQGIHKWAILRWSQLFAVGFQVAALGAAFSLILFTDLAFGWSTTLTSGDPIEDAATVHRLTSTLATPWAWAIESADPSIDLILESRFFRAAETTLTSRQAARLGAWWPFIIMTLLVYGLLPRGLTFMVARARLNAACRLTLSALPGLSSVLHRLHQARVQTTSDEPEERPTTAPQPDGPPIDRFASGRIGITINWSDVPVTPDANEQTFGPLPVHVAGGSAPVDNDRQLAETIAAELPPDTGVALLVKAWEPPLMELVDFLRLLRNALPDRTPIMVFPLGVEAEDALTGGTPDQSAVWRRKIDSIGDPWVTVGSAPEVPPS